jgi:hypothetical protein
MKALISGSPGKTTELTNPFGTILFGTLDRRMGNTSSPLESPADQYCCGKHPCQGSMIPHRLQISLIYGVIDHYATDSYDMTADMCFGMDRELWQNCLGIVR